MTKISGPGKAAAEAAARHACILTPEAAEDAAAAALAHAEDEEFIVLRQDRHRRSQPEVRQETRRRLRRELAAELAERGLVAAGPFTETLTYTEGWMPGAEVKEVPAAAAENGDAPWDHVQVKVSVPVRAVE